jgi:hypothetical protein
VIQEPPSSARRGWLVVGLALAAGATATVFFTENPLYLRVALLAVCWAFVVAAFLAGNRRADQVAAAGREAELRHAYDLELEREVAARHEYEVELESRLRQEAEVAMRTELTELRTELSGLSTLRDDLAAVARLRADLAGLGQLRTELAALTEIRGELAGLGQIRAQLAGLGELRGDLGRMRTELTEQLSGELLIERMVMRAQSVRGPAQSEPEPAEGRTLEGTPSWAPQPRPLGGGWDVDHWQETRVVPAEPGPRPIAGPPPVPPPVSPRLTSAFPQVDEESLGRHRPPSPIEWLVEESVLEPWVEPRPKSPLEWLGDQSLLDENGEPTGEIPVAVQPEPAPRRHRRAAEPDDEVAETGSAWSAAPSYEAPSYEALSYESASYQSGLFATSSAESSAAHGSSYDSSAYDEMLFGSAPVTSSTPVYETPSYESPSHDSSSSGSTSYGSSSDDIPSWSSSSSTWSADSSVEPAETATGAGFGTTSYDASGYGTAGDGAASEEPARRSPEAQGHARLEQILAESGVQAPSGGRSRRRRYRDEDDETAGDDVLARVLGRG